MRFFADSDKYMYTIDNCCLYSDAYVRWTGDASASASYSSTDTSVPASTGAWSVDDVPIGTRANISYTLPTYYTADFTASGLQVLGSSISGKTVTVSGIVENNVDFGFENYRQNTFTASSRNLTVKWYGVDGNHPAYAWVYQFSPADTEPSYIVDPNYRTVMISGAWCNYNAPAEYDLLTSVDVNVLPDGTFRYGIGSAYVELFAQVPYSANTYTGTKSDGAPMRYLLGSNGTTSNRDWNSLIGSIGTITNTSYVHNISASGHISGTINTVTSLMGWAEQVTFSSRYDIGGAISRTAYISGIAP